MSDPWSSLKSELSSTLSRVLGKNVEVRELPAGSPHGDFCLPCFGLSPDPVSAASDLASSVRAEFVIPISEGPYLNFRIDWEKFAPRLLKAVGPSYGRGNEGKKVMVEFCHANTHKELHIGHVRNLCIGEAVARILEFRGNRVLRANYQGDIGPHVAKCIWGYLNLEFPEPKDPVEKGRLLGKLYTEACKKAPEEEVKRITKALYEGDPETVEVWRKTREWSLEYFDSIYREFGVRFDRLYFESQTAEPGKRIALDLLRRGIAKISDGAVVVDLTEFDLGIVVLVTKEGYPLYPAKELGLAELQFSEGIDRCIHVVASEQNLYFKQVFKIFEMMDPELSAKSHHLSYELVRLKSGKMSSREGNVVTYHDVTEALRKKVEAEYGSESAGKVALAALKYGMLKMDTNTPVSFDLEEATKLKGDTGPYLLYTLVRAKSILEKAGDPGGLEFSDLAPEEIELLRLISRFPSVVKKSAEDLKPHRLARFLFDLSDAFNRFYEKHRVVGSEHEGRRLEIVRCVSTVLETGLGLLGIETVSRM